MWIRVKEILVSTELPIMAQLATVGAKLKLTANEPFPTFLMEYNDHLWLFNTDGGKVDTMIWTMKAIKFDQSGDIRDYIPELEWKVVTD